MRKETGSWIWGTIIVSLLLVFSVACRGESDTDGDADVDTNVDDDANVSGDWVTIRASTFTIGSPSSEPDRQEDESRQRVTITRDFWLQKTEVTQGQWRDVMGNNPSQFKGCGSSCPVEKVNWFEAVAYCNALSKREGLPECYRLSDCRNTPGNDMECSSVVFLGLNCRGYRLPTEAEWEYAARAETSGSYYGDLTSLAWYSDNSGNTTHRVGQKRPNTWGLHDMLGNVWEWCHDWYGEHPEGAVTDPIGPGTGSNRVIRGGSWGNTARYARVVNRDWSWPGNRLERLGFRPSKSLP